MHEDDTGPVVLASLVPARLRELGDELSQLRGIVLTCYAQVEFHLADLAVRCSALECYSGLPKKFPRKIEDRIAVIRKLMLMDGPMTPYRDELLPCLDHILKFSELRHVMAHAMTRMDISPTDHVITFEMYDIMKGGQLKLLVRTITLEHLRPNVQRLVLYANTLVDMFHRMRKEPYFPPRLSKAGTILPDIWVGPTGTPTLSDP